MLDATLQSCGPGEFIKRDRAGRLLAIVGFLHRHPIGVPLEEIAAHAGVSRRTVQRDLKVIESQMGVALFQQGNRWGVLNKSFMPPLKLTLLEAVTLFLGARLLARFLDRRDTHTIRAMQALAAVLPSDVARHVDSAVKHLTARTADAAYEKIFDLVTLGWVEGRKVRIGYPRRHADGEMRVGLQFFAPYFLEPNPRGHGCYVIGHDDRSNAIRCFKLERITDAELTDERFTIPEDFDPHARFDRAWIVSDEDPVLVRVRFCDESAAAHARENDWHPSQEAVELDDGTLELRLTVSGTTEILSWVLGWGAAVEVLEPPELRERVMATARGMIDRYA